MIIGFKFMGSRATVWAQVKQMAQERETAAKTVEKQEDELHKIAKKTNTPHDLFKSGAKIPVEV